MCSSDLGGGGIGSYQPPAASQPAVAAAPAPRVAAATPARPAGAAPGPHLIAPAVTHSVAPGETLSSLSRRYGKSRVELARANHIAASASLRVGQKLTIPGAAAGVRPAASKTVGSAPPRGALPAPAAAAQPKPQPSTAAPTQVAASPATARLATAVPTESASASRDMTGAVPSFRWPVRGRVIASYGAKLNGASNDGINLAVPEGTSVKAAEDGVVAYAGNELKGYGNLVLVRHANGFVTAYAHASEIMVKRGDQVKRGQVLARSGQTGTVNSPQLHFEIRKGSTPVDPTQYLTGG